MKLLFQKNIQSLLDNGNLKRYLTYAIGEIVLIMVGILLAFQVSNWSENRNNNSAEITYYKHIKRQLNEDKAIILDNIDYNKYFLDQFNFASQCIEANDRSTIDTLVEIALNLIRYSDFHRASNIYETILNSGQIKLLQNQKIIEGLQRLEETYVYINKMEDIHLDAIKLIILPDLVKTINFSKRKTDNADTLFSYEFQNRFAVMLEIMNEKKHVYDRAIQEINEIIAMIDKETT